MRIFHVATRADWEAAQASGAYTTSTRGASLAEEGFIHAARADQWEAVHAAYYADVAEPLVLLEIDTDLLDVPVQLFEHTLCLRSYAAAVTGRQVAEIAAHTIPPESLGDIEHTHRAIDDALGYAHLLGELFRRTSA